MGEPAQQSKPTFADVETAAARLAGWAVVTPLLEFPALDEQVGGRVLIKPEILQRTGSFKFRGAYNKISQLPEAKRPAGKGAKPSARKPARAKGNAPAAPRAAKKA